MCMHIYIYRVQNIISLALERTVIGIIDITREPT